MIEVLSEFGGNGVAAILWIARGLTETWVPGLVAILLMAFAFLLIVGMVLRGRGQRRAVEGLRRMVREARREFALPTVFADFCEDFRGWRSAVIAGTTTYLHVTFGGEYRGPQPSYCPRRPRGLRTGMVALMRKLWQFDGVGARYLA